MTPTKTCPSCSRVNPATLAECDCGADLINIRVDATGEADLPVDPPIQTPSDRPRPSSSTYVKVCQKCSTKNKASANRCVRCETDLSDVSPTLDSAAKYFVLESKFETYRYPVTQPLVYLGKEHEMKEHLANKQYVSRKHAKLTFLDGVLAITDLSSTNGTWVNGMRIPSDRPTTLKENDTVSLGAATAEGNQASMAAHFLVKTA